jgi:hypothetical protein
MRWTAPLLACVLALAACGDDDQAADTTEDAATTVVETSSTEDSTAGVSTTVAATTAGSTAPSGTTVPSAADMVEVEDLGVQFEAPAGWTAVDPQTVGDLTDESVMSDLSERTGVSTEALQNLMNEQIELFLFSGEAQGNIASNVNAIAIPIADMPTAEQITSDFERLGATDVAVEPVEAAGGDALVVRYRLPLDEDRVAEGYGLFVDTGDEVVNITVTTFDRAEADEVGELIRSTVTTLE